MTKLKPDPNLDPNHDPADDNGEASTPTTMAVALLTTMAGRSPPLRRRTRSLPLR